jgi:hypothetical protein
MPSEEKMASHKKKPVDDKHYRVKVKRPVEIGAMVLAPTTDNVVKGKVLNSLPDDVVDSYEEA